MDESSGEPWAPDWEIVGGPRQGGQGIVVRVKSKNDRTSGALKRLHQEAAIKSERRFRFFREVTALRKISFGVPLVLASNVEQWEDPTAPLFAVLEWIEGPTLGERVRGQTVDLDAAIDCTRSIAEIISECHKWDVVHRDLKPDNIILRDGDLLAPVLVDFGMAWVVDEANAEIKTDIGQELGNRFLRVPENAPGRWSRDPKTDVTFAVAILLCLLTRAYPRVLLDEHGQQPHEALADRFTAGIRSDRRWPRLERLFHRAFQTELLLRFQSASELIVQLDSLEPTGTSPDTLEDAVDRLKTVNQSRTMRQAATRFEAARAAAAAFGNRAKQVATEHRFALYVSGGHNQHCFTELIISLSNASQRPTVRCLNRITTNESEFVADYQIEGKSYKEYYRGSVADPLGLLEAGEHRVRTVLSEMIESLLEKVAQSK